jgi:very-short-patch-repair endonuclease
VSKIANYLRMARAQGKVDERMDSALEAEFALQMRVSKFPPWVRNHQFLEGSKKELDFAWPAWRFGVEVDGAVHRIADRFHRDYLKHAQALVAGWVVLRVDQVLVTKGEGVRYAEQLLLRARRAAEGLPPQDAFSTREKGRLSDSSDSGVGNGLPGGIDEAVLRATGGA